MTTGTPVSYFTGKYVDDLRDLYIASMISGLNCVSIGAPGWGKTDVALSMLMDVFPNEFAVLRVHPATPPEEVEGANDTAILLKESRLVKNIVGTPFDPAMKAILVDEIGRASKVLVGALMFLLDRKDVKHAAPVLATSNFMPKSVESEALLDRIALWSHITVSPATLDPKAMVAAQLGGLGSRLHVKGTLPSASDVTDVWDANPGSKAITAVGESLTQLTVDASAEGLHPHPRRLTQWSKLLYRMSVYVTGKADFSTVPDEAKDFLRFAWPAKTPEEHENWAQISKTAGDPVAALLADKMGEAAEKLNEFVGKFSSMTEEEVTNESLELGKFISFTSKAMAEFGNDPRIDEDRKELRSWYGNAIQGIPVERA